ncbi:hypothetical protein CUJ89_26315 [Burkholderia pyrrocinia]|uniref:Uncharacterized protein n=1 Tax=Burkholderia pyrrocinia TaxID=60550 RepID=A0A2Z5N2S0_BURPY|nr:hypothetical protein [Burkholderia pyrrocinia]AXF23889.1 hypothetical protein CUJ89_26315 [Burkholderia pyrrocinia]
MRAFDGAHGLDGWQWLFLLEVLSSVLLCFTVLRWLPNSIEFVQWLTADEIVPFMVSAIALAIAVSSSHGMFGTVLLFALLTSSPAGRQEIPTASGAGLYGFAACMLVGCALALAYPAKLVNR